MTKLSSAPARCRELPGSLTMLLPSSVAVPERCEIACCSTPISPTALMMPATHASTNAPYSTHLGNLLNWPPRAATIFKRQSSARPLSYADGGTLHPHVAKNRAVAIRRTYLYTSKTLELREDLCTGQLYCFIRKGVKRRFLINEYLFGECPLPSGVQNADGNCVELSMLQAVKQMGAAGLTEAPFGPF